MMSNGEYTKPTPLLILSNLLVILLIWWYRMETKKNKLALPPGPQGLPIVGYLPFLDPTLHTSFAKLAKTYGPILKVDFGRRPCIVLNSASLAKEVYKDQDILFSNRDLPAVISVATHGGNDISFSPNGDLWRMLRKISVRELLNPTTLALQSSLRENEVRDMIHELYLNKGKPVEISDYTLLAMFNLMTLSFWGDTIGKNERKRLNMASRKVLNDMFSLFGKPNVSDLFPILSGLDLQGLERQMKKHTAWFDQIFDYVIQKKMEMMGTKSNNGPKDFLQALLEFKEQGEDQNPITLTNIKAVLLDMLTGGTRTSSTTIEWVMTELMKNSKIMKKVQEELEEVVGINNIVEESHLSKLNYLNAVLKEGLRVHPVAPLLAPKKPPESTVVGGYMIPKNSLVIVNAWAIQRDPQYWEDPLEFKPERFLDPSNEINFKGANHNYIPFGSGRRICDGVPMAEKLIPYTLASLVHSFNWKMPEGVELDLSDTFGLELRKTIPLVVIPEPRLTKPTMYM